MAIRDNLKQVNERIIAAASRAGREPSEITLVAISKTKPAELIRDAASAGATVFGENRVQEADKKIPELSDLTAEWHLVGHLQTNKAKKAVQLFDMIHSVDSPRLVEALDKEAGKQQKHVPILLQVNIAEEEQKYGTSREEFDRLLESAAAASFLRVRGLMVMPPFSDNPEDSRPYFRALRRMSEEYIENLSGEGDRVELSMGMTADFEVAIEEGATLVRVGTAIFGAR